MGFTACNARVIDGQGKLIAGGFYWFGQDRAPRRSRQVVRPIDATRVPTLDTTQGTARWQGSTPYRLYTKRVVHWVWVSTSSMMFRRSLINLVFPADDEVFRLHMDFYVVVMAQMVAGSLLIDEALYSYRLHGATAPPTIRAGWTTPSFDVGTGQHLFDDARSHARCNVAR